MLGTGRKLTQACRRSKELDHSGEEVVAEVDWVNDDWVNDDWVNDDRKDEG